MDGRTSWGEFSRRGRAYGILSKGKSIDSKRGVWMKSAYCFLLGTDKKR
jgi:hypothetical protein